MFSDAFWTELSNAIYISLKYPKESIPATSSNQANLKSRRFWKSGYLYAIILYRESSSVELLLWRSTSFRSSKLLLNTMLLTPCAMSTAASRVFEASEYKIYY